VPTACQVGSAIVLPKKEENRKKKLRSSVKAVSASSLMPTSHATKGKTEREEEDTCNQSLLLGEEPNPRLSSSHMHASLSLASLQQLLYQYHVSHSSTGEAQTHDQYEASRALLLHHNSTEFLSFWLPNLLQPGSL
jgi:hypothetical protein